MELGARVTARYAAGDWRDAEIVGLVVAGGMPHLQPRRWDRVNCAILRFDNGEERTIPRGQIEGDAVWGIDF